MNYTRDFILSLLFASVALFSFYRVWRYFDLTKEGIVITTFYLLILLTGLVRALWFLIPQLNFNVLYLDPTVLAYSSKPWFTCLFSELLLSLGNVLLFSIFILICCHWREMLVRASSAPPSEDTQLQNKVRGRAMPTFTLLIAILVVVEVANIVAFMCGAYPSGGIVVFDSVLFTLLSIVILVGLTVLSYKIRAVLYTIGSISSRSTRPQMRRIAAITIAANGFFIIRAVTESALLFYFIGAIQANQPLSKILTDHFWDFYVTFKYSAEVGILLLELIISTAIKAYGEPDVATKKSSNLRATRKYRGNQYEAVYSPATPSYGSNHQPFVAPGSKSKLAENVATPGIDDAL